MAVFGGYESVGQSLSRVGLAVIWRARRTEPGSGPVFAVKAIEPTPEMASPEEARRKARGLLDSARVQAKVAASGGRHWAPVHEQGETADGAFYVTDYYPQTISGLIRGRARLSSKSLVSLVCGIVDGLRELDLALSRPHGNLKPTNVLVSEAKESSGGNVVLADPLPDSEIDTAAGRTADLSAIGNVIFRLVCHRAFNPVGDWPIGDNRDWSALGKSAAAWRELCNILLSPNLASQGVKLEDIAARLADIGKAEQAARKPIFIAAVLAVLAAAAAVGAFLVFFRPEPAMDRQFAYVCKDCYNWLRTLASGEKTNTVPWNKDEALRKMLEVARNNNGRITEFKELLKDRTISAGYDAAQSAEWETAKIRGLSRRLADTQVKSTIDALAQCVQDIGQAYASWAVRADLEQRAKTYADRKKGWETYAGWVGDLASPETAPGVDLIDRVERIDKLMKSGVLERIEGYWSAIERAEQAAAKAAKETKDVDPILSQFPDMVAGTLKDSTAGATAGQEVKAENVPELLATLETQLKNIAAVSAGMEACLSKDWPTVKKDEVRGSEVYTKFQATGGGATLKTFQEWVASDFSKYYVDAKWNPFIVDRSLEEAKSRIENLCSDFEKYRDFLADDEKRGELRAFKDELSGLWSDVEQGRGRQVSAKSRADEVAKKNVLQNKLDNLDQRIKPWKTALESPATGPDPRGDFRTYEDFRRYSDDITARIEGKADAEEKARLKGALAKVSVRKEIFELRWVTAYERTIRSSFEPAKKELDALEEALGGLAAPTEVAANPLPVLEALSAETQAIAQEMKGLRADSMFGRLNAELEKAAKSFPSAAEWEKAGNLRRNEIAKTAAGTKDQLDSLKAEAKKFLDEAKQYPPDLAVSGLAPIQGFWASVRNSTVGGAKTVQDLAQLADWRNALAELDSGLARERLDPSVASYLTTAERIFDEKRESALADAFASSKPASAEALRGISNTVKQGLTRLNQEMSELAASTKQVNDLLDEANGAAEIVGAYKTLAGRGLFGDFKGKAETRITDLEDSVRELDALRTNGKDALLGAAKESNRPAVAYNAWRALGAGADWIADAGDVTNALAITDHLLVIMDSRRWAEATNSARLKEILSVREQYLLWFLGRDQQTIQENKALLDRFASPDDVFSKKRFGETMPPSVAKLVDKARYDKNLWEFRDDCSKKGWAGDKKVGLMEDREIRLRVRRFAEEEIPESLKDHSKVKILLAKFDEMKNIKAEGTEQAHKGPQAPAWALNKSDDVTTVVYSWKDGAHDHRLAFRRVTADGQDAFVSTTEVSVGLFGDVVSSAGNWGDLMKIWEAPAARSWDGPRSWELDNASGYKLGENREWWLVPPTEKQDWYQAKKEKAGADKDMPKAEHPMQYISPQVAKSLASLLGCRLPTASEWKAAWEQEGRPDNGNLRDGSWKSLFDEIAKKSEDGANLSGPNEGVFGLRGLAVSNNLVEGSNDGHIWFEPVETGGTKFHLLVGNVAEFVYSDKSMRTFAVIGGSALSPPELWDGKAKPFSEAYPYDKANRKEFSDVGFRLAFDAPQKSIIEVLNEAVAAAKYLDARD